MPKYVLGAAVRLASYTITLRVIDKWFASVGAKLRWHYETHTLREEEGSNQCNIVASLYASNEASQILSIEKLIYYVIHALGWLR